VFVRARICSSRNEDVAVTEWKPVRKSTMILVIMVFLH
jgi:hypothetical protein